jgi:amino acid transporter
MKKISTLRKLVNIGIGSLVLITALITLSGDNIQTQSKGLMAEIQFGIKTDDFSIGVQTGNANQPGCDGSNCLSVPDSSIYKGIAGEVNLRQSLINWTNFFLGFLSLIAMIALVFAGFLYVTSMGEDEQATKAKKIIMYVVIGIIVILIAYALVNTLIEDGPTGSDLGGNILQTIK